MTDEIEVVSAELLAAGGAPGSSLHSWRCEYPDRYGECTCVHDLATAIVGALHNGAPLTFTERRQHSAERQLTQDLAAANPPGWPYPATDGPGE